MTLDAIDAIDACREDRWDRYYGGIDGGEMREGRSDVEHPSDICSFIGISSRLQLEQQLRERLAHGMVSSLRSSCQG